MPMYNYYAVIEREKLDESGCYIVSFPDIENCYTDADTLTGAVSNAEDVLGLMLSEFEADGTEIPSPKKAGEIEVTDGASLVLITVNTDDFKEAM